MTAVVFGALLGNQTNREVSIVNSFELILENINESEDVTMSESSETRKITLDVEFLLTRREQCSSCGMGGLAK